MGIITFPQSLSVDNSLLPYFGWAGTQYPFVPSGATDITISGATTWNDSVGYKQINKLTINAGQTLTIAKFPFYIFCNELNFGDSSSCIDASGLSGNSSLTAFPSTYARGATANQFQCGCGGGLIFIIAGKITGASGIIKANGGNGYISNQTGANTWVAGQGALSTSFNIPNSTALESFYVSPFVGGAPTSASNYYYTTSKLLGAGGTAQGGVGGGSGGSASGVVGGGSGIGGGGGCNGTAATTNGSTSSITLQPQDLLFLASIKCLGGGGGGTGSTGSSNQNNASGGGGGGIVVWTHSYVSQPTVQANGGNGTNIGGWTCNGGAGVTFFIVL